MKKSKIIVTFLLCLILLNSSTYANTLKVMNSNSGNNVINEDIKFTKKIVNYDTETQEIEIELCIENIKRNVKNKEDIEVVVVLDNSDSMKFAENNSTRKNNTVIAANRFVNLIYDNITKLKLGVVQYSHTINVLTSLTDSKEQALNAIKTYSQLGYGASTETDKALQLAKTQFSSNCKNKVVILVTDGYPTDASKTKNTLKSLEENNISVLSLIIGQNNETIKNVFGTEENPTAGQVYYITNNSEIDKIFNEFMYQQIIDYMEHPINNIRIEDVFPKNILEYFDIEYENIPANTTVSDIGENDSFTWYIDELTGEEVAIFRYKIKIKKNVDITKLIGEELKTNEKVIIKYEDEDGNEQEEILDKNPSIKIEEDEPITEVDDNNDEINEEEDNQEQNEQQEDNNQEESNQQEQQEFVIVDFTPPDTEPQPEPNIPSEPEQQIPNQKTDNTTTVQKLPQTGGPFETAIIISIVASIILAIKLKLSTKDIFIVRK